MTEPKPLALIASPHQFPPTVNALSRPNGLLAVSQSISAGWLLESYKLGIFPWYSQGEPVLWWSPSPRAVLYTQDFKYRRSLKKKIRSLGKHGDHKVTMNMAFEQVMRSCAEPREDGLGTWITEDIIQSYVEFHQQGFAHSVEHWSKGELVGGLYCVSMGQMVYGESMFSRAPDASKIAFAHLVAWLAKHNVRIIDCQQATEHLLSLGAVEIPRAQFESELQVAMNKPTLPWQTQTLDWLE